MLLQVIFSLYAGSGACTHVVQARNHPNVSVNHKLNSTSTPTQNYVFSTDEKKEKKTSNIFGRETPRIIGTDAIEPAQEQPVSIWTDLRTIMFAAPGKLRDHSMVRFRQEVEQEVKKFRDEHEYVLFQAKDMYMWIIFAVLFVALILFDNLVLHRSHEAISLTRALLYTVFWMFCGFCWGVAVYFHRGTDAAINWATAYMLEWMLSIDCLFFFHIIFKIFSTPDHLKHKPLFYGICGAIVFRMIFFSIEEVIIHSSFWAHMIFGAFLVYTGIKSATMGDEQFDPRENVIFKFICKYVPLLNGYHDDGYFFVKVPVCIETGTPLVELVALSSRYSARKSRRSSNSSKDEEAGVGSGSQRSTESEKPPPVYTDQDLQEAIAMFTPRRFQMRWRATLLLMVVLCLEVTDLIFAVDSVSAIVAEVPDLFLAYTASVFAMLGLRAMFFVTDELMHLFILLKYGIAAILVVIGVKLMLSHWLHIHPLVMLIVLVSIFVASILGSLCLSWYRKMQGQDSHGHPAKKEPETSAD